MRVAKMFWPTVGIRSLVEKKRHDESRACKARRGRHECLRHVLLLLCVTAVWAQESDKPKAPSPASIRGTVTEVGSGRPLPDVEVSVNNTTPQVRAVTDAQGHYELKGLEPRLYRIVATALENGRRTPFGAFEARQVTLLAGLDLEGFDFRLSLPGQISGRVLDQNKEPVPGITVFRVVREYVAGALRTVLAGVASTDDLGEYHFAQVTAGRSFVLLAQKSARRLEAISDAPADPRLRRPAVVPTYYPNARSMDGAQALVLRSGEQRDGVEIRLARSQAFCLEGIVEGGSGPSDLSFEIGPTAPASGTSGNGGFYFALPGGTPGADGKIRICDLHPGDYELNVRQYAKGTFGQAPFFGSTVLTVGDRDLQNVRVSAGPRIPLAGEVVWDGSAPETPVDAQLRVDLQAVTRTERGSFTSSIPGSFSLEGGLLMDEFAVKVANVPMGVYVKDITYGGQSILNGGLRLGGTVGDAALRIVLAHDGGSARVSVTNKDGDPVADCTIILMPASASNEAVLAESLVTGKTDVQGSWTSIALAPGKYYVLATDDVIDKSFETIAKLWRARTGATEVDISTNVSTPLKLVPRSIE